MVACEERAGLHAEIDGVEVHHEPIAPGPAEVAEGAAGGIAVLHFGGDVEEEVELVEVPSGLAEVEGGLEQLRRAERAVVSFRLVDGGGEERLRALFQDGLAVKHRRAGEARRDQQCKNGVSHAHSISQSPSLCAGFCGIIRALKMRLKSMGMWVLPK